MVRFTARRVVDDDVVEVGFEIAAAAGSADGAFQPAQPDEVRVIGGASAQTAALEGHCPF